MNLIDTNLVNMLKDGGVAIAPTDTIYGVVGSALNPSVVSRIYALRKRNPEKPCIILISDTSELQNFGIVLTPEQKKEIEKYREPTSFILECDNKKFEYLHRGTKTLAFRIPILADLRNLLKQAGPLIAPSANPEGLPPAQNISEAKNYFGDGVDLYIDGGEIRGKASKVIKLHKDGAVTILRA